MFEIGDYVLNATNGICKISEIVELDMSGDKKLKSYFLLRPVEEENDRVYIPVDNADKRIRKVITQDEAKAVLDRVPEIEALVVNNEKERETRYKEAVRSKKSRSRAKGSQRKTAEKRCGADNRRDQVKRKCFTGNNSHTETKKEVITETKKKKVKK